MEQNRKDTFKSGLWTVGRYTTSLILIFLLLRGSRFHSLVSALKSVNALHFLMAVFLFFVAHLISAAKWRVFAGKTSLVGLYKWTLIANYYSMLLVGQISGDVMRIVGMRHIGNKSRWVALTFYDRLSGLIGLLLISFICLLFSPVKEQIPSIFYKVTIVSMAIACLTACSTSLVVRNTKHLSNLCLFRSGKFTVLLSWLAAFSGNQFRGWNKWILFFMFSLLFHILTAVIVTVIARNILPAVSIIDWCWILGVISLLTLFPLSAGGLGIREVGFVGVLHLMGYPREPALAVSLIIYAIQMTGAITGAVLNLTDFWKKKDNYTDQSIAGD